MKKKILVIENNHDFLKENIKFFISSDTYEVVSNTADAGALELIPSIGPDLIILDLINSRADDLLIFERFCSDKRIKTIVISDSSGEQYSKAMALGADYYIMKPLSFSYLKDIIDKMFNSKNIISKSAVTSGKNTAEEMITNIFNSIGIPAHIKGYYFLREAIILTMENIDLVSCITKKLYPQVAIHFDTSPGKVERSIRHAIEVAWHKGRITNINSIFGVNIYDHNEKPTNGELIALLADRMLLAACG